MKKKQQVTYYFDGIEVQLRKESTGYNPTIHVRLHQYTIYDVEATKEFRDYHNTLHICFETKEAYNSCVKDDMLEIKTGWHNFNVKWHKRPYKQLPDSMCMKFHKNGIRLSLTIPKNKYIPEDWVGSYENYMKQLKLDRDSKTRCGYVSNRTKADYSNTNVHNPFLGGSFSPK